jgi:hypothetical protein
MKRKPTELEEGYRWVLPGDTLHENDQHWNIHWECWLYADNAGCRVNKNQPRTYRRLIDEIEEDED